MENLKQFSAFSHLNLGNDLLTLQNGGLVDKTKDYCDLDLKLVCSDGYLMAHKALLPNHQTSISSKSSEHLETISLQNLSIIQASKLLFLIYTGEVLISKSDHKAIKPILEAFKVFGVKRAPLSRGPTPTRTINTRRSLSCASTASSGGGIVTSGSTKEEITRRKIAAVKNLLCLEGEEEHVFIFGDGTIMEIPMTSTYPASPSSTNLVLDLNGQMILDDLSADKGFHCAPCSLIFCDRSDFMDHSSSSNCLNNCPPPPLTPTVRVIKMEPDFIQVKEEIHVDTVYFEDDPYHSAAAANTTAAEQVHDLGGPLNLCLICVTPFKSAAELMVHTKQKHFISSEKDYDYGSWTCKWCETTCGSIELSVFLQHAYHCKKENRMSRKRSASISPPRNKRRKTQTPPLITSDDNLNLSSVLSTPSPITPQANQTASQPMKSPLPEPQSSSASPPPEPQSSSASPPPQPQSSSASPPPQSQSSSASPPPPPLKSPPSSTKTSFRIPKLSQSTTSTPSQKPPPRSTHHLINNTPNSIVYPCRTPLIPRLPIKKSPHNFVRRPKLLLSIRNSSNRKLNLMKGEEPPFLSNPPIIYKGVNITLTSGTGVPTKPATPTLNQPATGKKRKAVEIPVPLQSSTKKQKKTSEPKVISPWTCRWCPTKTFATQKEYMHHDCRR